MGVADTLLNSPVVAWLDERLRVRGALSACLSRRAARSWPACLGTLALLLLLSQLATGLLLLVHYRPTPEALTSLVALERDFRWGWLLRALHCAGANLLLLAAAVHLGRVVAAGAYKRPRELHWVSGCLLFWLACLMAASGALLPWTPQAQAMARAATDLLGLAAASSPGPFLALHLLLVFALLGLLAGHLALVRRTGLLAGDRTGEHPYGLPMLPLLVLGTLGLLVGTASFAPGLFQVQEFQVQEGLLPPGMGAGLRPPWYLLAAGEVLRLAPTEAAGAGILGGLGLMLVLLPLWDLGRRRPFWERAAFSKLVVGWLIACLVLTAWGWLGL
jgi:ubiquinol-cytochrome c reductase cytochrome b/c1 subunit